MFNRGMLLLLVAGSADCTSYRLRRRASGTTGISPNGRHRSRPEGPAGASVRKGILLRAGGEWVRTYPVYFPGREPEGYWQMLQSKKPEPLITPGARTEGRMDRRREARISGNGRAGLPHVRPEIHREDPLRRKSSRNSGRHAHEGRHRVRLAMGSDREGAGAVDFRVLGLPHPDHAGRQPTGRRRKATIRPTTCFSRSCNRRTRLFSREIPRRWRHGASLAFRGSPMTYTIGSRRCSGRKSWRCSRAIRRARLRGSTAARGIPRRSSI